MLFWEIFKSIVQNLMNSPKVVKCGITFTSHFYYFTFVVDFYPLLFNFNLLLFLTFTYFTFTFPLLYLTLLLPLLLLTFTVYYFFLLLILCLLILFLCLPSLSPHPNYFYQGISLINLDWITSIPPCFTSLVLSCSLFFVLGRWIWST